MQDQEIRHQPSCEDELNIGLLTVAEAQARILEGVTPVTETETLPVREALGRVLAQEVVSPIDVPSHTNSAMDGYAVRAADLPETGVRDFPVPGTSWAGRPWLEPIEPGPRGRRGSCHRTAGIQCRPAADGRRHRCAGLAWPGRGQRLQAPQSGLLLHRR
jgi:hypothetical protein